MKIGIGISSYKRPEHLELCLRQIFINTFDLEKDFMCPKLGGEKLEFETIQLESGMIFKIFVAKDIPNIAKAKNECLYNLRDCDHIFLFDEDCFPIKDGWVEFFINTLQSHLLYLTQRHNLRVIIGDEGGLIYNDCGGCFMYIRKDAFEKVGYFNSEYKQYGYEHAAYSKRIYPNLNGYVSWAGIDQYLYSLDYQGEGDWGVKHVPSITDYKAMQESIDYNRKVFEKEINGDKIYYEYNK